MLDINQYLNGDQLFDGHFQLIKPLSTDGGTADVWLARDVNTIDNDIDGVADEEMLEETGMLVAIKIYRPKNALDIEGEQQFRDEYRLSTIAVTPICCSPRASPFSRRCPIS